jgi:hypothetical protein
MMTQTVLRSMKEVLIVLGIELGYLIALPCLQVPGGWRIVFGAALVPVPVMLTGLVCPHSFTSCSCSVHLVMCSSLGQLSACIHSSLFLLDVNRHEFYEAEAHRCRLRARQGNMGCRNAVMTSPVDLLSIRTASGSAKRGAFWPGADHFAGVSTVAHAGGQDRASM